ncbi:hypothetical protein WA026_010485 [Henosepilachna vigintioctopunctata]|uniref:Uncharacterized protein n=1 Tax=Henosepilachna vigintioctopunctata TaxID=420089 RepID=A0AAW1VCB7_9CUCU
MRIFKIPSFCSNLVDTVMLFAIHVGIRSETLNHGFSLFLNEVEKLMTLHRDISEVLKWIFVGIGFGFFACHLIDVGTCTLIPSGARVEFRMINEYVSILGTRRGMDKY